MKPAERRPERQAGSILVLLPATFLVVLALGAIAADTAAVHLRQREVAEAARAAANDGVAAGLDGRALRTTGDLRVDRSAAVVAALASVEASTVGQRLSAAPVVDVAPDGTVSVELRSLAPRLLSAALPGSAGGVEVAARAEAEAVWR